MNDDRPCVGEVIAELQLCLNPLYKMHPEETIGPHFAPITVRQAIDDLEAQLNEMQAVANQFGNGYVIPAKPDFVYDE